MTHFKIFGSKAWARIPTEKRKDLQPPQSQEFLFVGYFEYSKGYKLIKLSTKKSFIERSVQFEEDPLAEVEVGESSSPPDPLNVSGETNNFVDFDMSDNYYFMDVRHLRSCVAYSYLCGIESIICMNGPCFPLWSCMDVRICN